MADTGSNGHICSVCIYANDVMHKLFNLQITFVKLAIVSFVFAKKLRN